MPHSLEDPGRGYCTVNIQIFVTSQIRSFTKSYVDAFVIGVVIIIESNLLYCGSINISIHIKNIAKSALLFFLLTVFFFTVLFDLLYD